MGECHTAVVLDAFDSGADWRYGANEFDGRLYPESVGVQESYVPAAVDGDEGSAA